MGNGRWLVAALALGAAACPSNQRPRPVEPPPTRAPATPAELQNAREAGAAEGQASGGTIYVAAYSSLSTAERNPILLGVTLDVRNVDLQKPITLRYVDYYDTPGHRMRRYLTEPREIGPLGTAEFVVAVRDDFGGPGANFLIGWTAQEGTHAPLVETVMIGHAGSGYVSFTSRGIEVE